MENEVLYKECHHFKIVGLVSLLLVPFSVAGTFFYPPLAIVFILTLAVGLLLTSLGIYHKITLTSQALAVGRETFAINDLDLTSKAMPAEDLAALPDEEISVRLVGGAWGPPMGSRVVAICLRQRSAGDPRRLILVSSYRSAAFMAALNGLLERG